MRSAQQQLCDAVGEGVAVGRLREEEAGFLLRGKQDRIQWSIFPLRMGPRWVPNGYQVGPESQVGPRWVPGGSQVGPRCGSQMCPEC